MGNTVFTIGHSNHTLEKFVDLLKRHGITVLCDVRSAPYSRANPQFNREPLKDFLRKSGITYIFLGAELGARSEDPSCYDQGKVRYDRLAETELFRQGINRVQEEVNRGKVALMCAEKEPLECHRAILVARRLEADGFAVQHILGDGRLESHSDALVRLVHQLKLQPPGQQDMFLSREDILMEAYGKQAERIAYSADVFLASDSKNHRRPAG
ncbi:MAG: DUF488 domain-containing protein [Nitrospinae bacterium]|nr:DUF488 domain-containing protein [Nitrospinota bacterium]